MYEVICFLDNGGEVMIWNEELSERKMQILRTLIDDYIKTAQPIGSRTISRKHALGVSSATIRNEMADLEDMGYISQPHTSAGRIPSDKGYRFYVDHLMQIHELQHDEIKKIRDAIEVKINEINTLVHCASDIISTFTGYASIALPPNLNKAILKSVQVLSIDEKRVLVVAVTSGGVVNNQVVRIGFEPDQRTLKILSNYLHEKVNGLIIGRIKFPPVDEIRKETGAPVELIIAVIEGLKQCLQDIDESALIMNGITNLLNHPEFNDLPKVKEVFELLNDQGIIKELLNSAMNKEGLNFQIGSENENEVMRDCTLVTTVYSVGETELGTFGILGPTRMSYSRVFSTISYIRKLINSEILRILNDE